jgi:hypothetical protein
MTTVPGGITFPTGIDDSGRETVENTFVIGETEVTYYMQTGLVGFAAADAQYADIGFRVACTSNE